MNTIRVVLFGEVARLYQTPRATQDLRRRPGRASGAPSPPQQHACLGGPLCAVRGDCGSPRCHYQVNRNPARVGEIKSLRKKKKKKSMLVKLSHLLLKAKWNFSFSYSLGYFLPVDRLRFCLSVVGVRCRGRQLWTEAFRCPSWGPRG